MITNKKNKKISFVFQLTQKIYRVTKATYLIKVMRNFFYLNDISELFHILE